MAVRPAIVGIALLCIALGDSSNTTRFAIVQWVTPDYETTYHDFIERSKQYAKLHDYQHILVDDRFEKELQGIPSHWVSLNSCFSCDRNC